MFVDCSLDVLITKLCEESIKICLVNQGSSGMFLCLDYFLVNPGAEQSETMKQEITFPSILLRKAREKRFKITKNGAKNDAVIKAKILCSIKL